MTSRALAAIAFVLAVGSSVAQSPDLAAPTRLTGRVLDAAGKPIADAAVGVVGRDWYDAQVAVQPSMRTGADGRFAVVVTQWPRIPRQIVVVAAGHATAEWALSTGYDEHPTMLGRSRVHLGEFVLREGVLLRGKVRTMQGRPLADAEVEVVAPAELWAPWTNTWGRRQVSRGRTDAQGGFTVVAARGQGALMTARARAHFSKQLGFVAPGDPLVFALEPSREYRGKLRRADGTPVRGEACIITARGDIHGRTGTAADGSFRVTLEAEGATDVHGYEWGIGRGIAVAKLPAADDEVWLQLPAVPPVPLRVIDATTGQPVAAASVTVGWFLGGTPTRSALDGWPVAITDAVGRAHVEGPTSGGEYSGFAEVRAPGYAPALVRGIPAQADATRVPIELYRGIVLVGKVQDEDGKPVPEALVSAFGDEDEILAVFDHRRRAAVVAVADAVGAFSLPPLVAGKWQLEVAARGYVPRVANRTVRADREPAPLVLTVAPSGAVFGKLIGAPIGNGWAVRAESWRAHAANALREAGPPDSPVAHEVAPDGTFSIREVGGRCVLTLSIPAVDHVAGFLIIDLGAVRIDGETGHEIDISKRIPGAVRGRVRTTGAELPHPRMVVELAWPQPHAGLVARQTLAPDGTFALPAVAGRYLLRVVDARAGLVLAERSVTVAAAATLEVDFTLALTELRLKLIGPPARLRTLFLELRCDLQASGARDLDVDRSALYRRLASCLPLRDAGMDFDLCVPLVPFRARLHEDAWGSGNPVAEVDIEPRAKRTNALELRLGH